MPKLRKKIMTKKSIPYGKVALLWANGQTVSEISDQMGWTRAGEKFPYSYAYGVLKKLREWVSLGLIAVRITKKGHTTQRQPSHSDGITCPLCGASDHRTKTTHRLR